MPTITVRTPDGQAIPVDAPEGASRQDIIRLAKQKSKEPPPASQSPVVSPDTPGLLRPSVGQYLATGARNRAGDILSMAGGAFMPGSGLLGLASRLAGSEAGEFAGQTVTGQRYTPGLGAGGQLVGEGIGRAVSPLLSPVALRGFAKRTARAAGDWLKANVPAFERFGSDAKGLYAIAHDTGQRALSDTFEKEISGLKRSIPVDTPVTVRGQTEIAGHLFPTEQVRNAHALIDELPTLRKAGGKPYYAALRALADDLPAGLAPELDSVRRAYRFGAGFIDFARRGRFLHGERFDPAQAHAALDRYGDALTRRGMDPLRAIIRGPGAKPIEPSKHGAWERRIYGATLGEIAGFPFGAGGRTAGPLIGGAAGEALLPRTTYRNVPLTPAGRFAERAGPVVVGQAAREAARFLGIPDAAAR